MALPKLLQKLFQNGGAGAKLNESIMPFAYARSVNGKQPDSVGNIEIPARNVGDEWHSFTGQIPVGGVPYCGQEVTRATYADLWTWVQAQGLVKAESEWQALSTSQNGNVPFYSDGDGSTTFRMPKVVGYIKGAASQSEAGAYTAEGLPNHTHYVSRNCDISNEFVTNTDVTDAGDTVGNYNGYGTKLTSSVLNDPIYGHSDHVTPETSVILFGVYAFGEITNVGALDADTLATGLANVETGLASKINISTPHIVETWKSADGLSWYRKYSDGWIEQGGWLAQTLREVTFITPFSNTNYTILATIDYVSASSGAGGHPQVRRGTASSFFIRVMVNSPSGGVQYADPCWWYACGY